MPLAVGGLMLLISGPSMIMAYMKLRQRNLGPILDANGWAVNTAARINIPFGSTLTGTAELPRGAQRSMRDPFADKKRPWKFYLFLAIVFAVLGALWQKGYLGEWWGQLRNKAEQASAEVAPAPAEPAPSVPAEAAKPAS